MYLVISGGAYGLEGAVGIAGARLTILLCLVVPLTLSLPTALMAAELTALMPVEGGFYFWVKEAFGPFWGFTEAYLTILYTAVDMAIYPVLFTTYLSFVIPISIPVQVVLGIVLVWLAGLLNILGIRPVGNTSVGLTAILLAPFAAMVVIGLPRLIHWQPPAPLAGGDLTTALAGGLTVVIWNFCGWENLSVVAAEIENPQRNYLRAVAFTLPLVVIGYLLPLGVSLSGAGTTAGWEAGQFAAEGYRIGGPLLGIAIGLGGAVCAFAVFEAAMLWVSRMPFVLASEHYLPAGLTEIWSETATPGRSILLCCVVFTILVPLGFVTLVILDVFFYMGALVLEMLALIRHRKLHPDRTGLFVIGGGRATLWLVAAAPVLTWCATFGLAISQGQSRSDFIAALILAACVWPVYVFLRRRYHRPLARGGL
jgi:amino acid transporter